jgi:hypothetical protein
MADSGIRVAIIASITGAITLLLNRCRFLYDHHPDSTYELIIAFERTTSEQSQVSEISQHPHLN